MKRIYAAVFFVIAVLLVLAGLSPAQVAKGTPPFSSTGGGPFDAINLGNLNAHFAVPVVHKAGRGMSFAYDLSYDSSIWTPVPSNGTSTWSPAINWGWSGQTASLTGFIDPPSVTELSCTYYDPPYRIKEYYTKYIYSAYTDKFGVSHYAPGLIVYEPAADCGPQTDIITKTASDGSGWTITVSAGSTMQSVASRSGDHYIVPVGTGASGTLKDANGNEITLNGTGQFFDTLSATTPVLTVAGVGNRTSPLTFTYTSPSGNVAYTMKFNNQTVHTYFRCSGITDYPATANIPLVSEIDLPDSSKYSFAYEASGDPNYPGSVTGRISSITLPTGGTITYSYSGGTNGINCSDGSAATLTRTLSPGGQWVYTRSGGGNSWTTTVQDPNSNQTTITFQKDSATTSNFYETSRVVTGGSGTLQTVYTCYNGNGLSTPSSCATTAVATPITRQTIFTCLPDCTGKEAETNSVYDTFGLVNEVDEYDYGSGAVGPLLRKTITAYTTGMGNGIVDRPASVAIKDSSNNTVAYTSYTYDEGTPAQTSGTPQHVSVSGSRGLLTTVAVSTGSTTLYRSYTYNDTGTLASSKDVSTTKGNGAPITYSYSPTTASCGNSFVTSITEPLNMSRSMTWDCNGGVLLSLTDENGKVSSTAYSGANYNNVFWRPYSTTDGAGTTTNYFYYLNGSNQRFQTEIKYANTFNGGNSTVDILKTTDGLGRTIFQQTRQGPSAPNYDTRATCYDNSGRVSLTTLEYSAPAITQGTASCPTGNAGTSYSYDALNRTTSVSDSGGGSITSVYSYNDVTETISSPAQVKQLEYDALGRLISLCESTGGTQQFPGGPCNQSVAASGYLTQYGYDARGDRTSVTQNAQAGTAHQTRTYTYDMLGRLLSETTPETNNVAATYTYDSVNDSACGSVTSAGNKVKRVDANLNATCYKDYDAFHRVGTMTYPSSSTPEKHFVYDTASVNGTNMQNAKTRLAEAYTGPSNSKVTDLFFSYWATGQPYDVWELTPHSGTNYYYRATTQPWPNGAINTLSNLSVLPTITYSADGEGRMSTVTASSGQSPLASSVTYNPLSQVTGLTFGSSDTDSFVFDSNTGRMLDYYYNVGSPARTDHGHLAWNSNGTPQQVSITDQITGTSDSQICTYTYDDLARVASSDCGCSLWSQNFSYDPFGNITKTVPNGCTGMSFSVNYDYTNNTNRIITSPFAYNGNNGAMTADNVHAYGWDNENRVVTIDSGLSSGVCLTYDALDRVVEQGKGSSCNTSFTQIVYSPSGGKLALMNGATLVKAFVPLPSGAQAVYNSSGVQYYRHADWLGSSRLASLSSQQSQPYFSGAYAPFGENYAQSGTQDLSFTGQDQDTESSGPGGAGGLYDFLYREHSPVQGRWLSPDPLGQVSGIDTDPQTWNRYAYVDNAPLDNTDPTGLCRVHDGCHCNDGGGDGRSSRSGGVSPGNETLGLPQGLNTAPLGFGDLLGLSPGTQCDFGVCDSIPVEGFTDGITCGALCATGKWWQRIKLMFLLEAALQAATVRVVECEANYQDDLRKCRKLADPGARARCYDSATNRRFRCEQGWDPLPPLVTW